MGIQQGRCRRCGKEYRGLDFWHQRGFCTWACEVKEGEDNLDRSARRIGRFMGEMYNPELER